MWAAIAAGALAGVLVIWACDNEVRKDATNECDPALKCRDNIPFYQGGHWCCVDAKIINKLHTECKPVANCNSNCSGVYVNCARFTTCKVIAGTPMTCDVDTPYGLWSRTLEKTNVLCEP